MLQQFRFHDGGTKSRKPPSCFGNCQNMPKQKNLPQDENFDMYTLLWNNCVKSQALIFTWFFIGSWTLAGAVPIVPFHVSTHSCALNFRGFIFKVFNYFDFVEPSVLVLHHGVFPCLPCLFNNWWITWMQNVVRISDDYCAVFCIFRHPAGNIIVILLGKGGLTSLMKYKQVLEWKEQTCTMPIILNMIISLTRMHSL